MLRIFLMVILVLAFYFNTGPHLWIVADVPPLTPHISLDARAGVSAFDAEIARRGAAFAAREIEQQLGLNLTRRVTVVLAPDSLTYTKILSEEEGLSRESALAQSAMTSGGSREDRVIVNVGGIDLYTDALFVVAHEMTHQYYQASFGDVLRLSWLIEGIADWTAARSVAANAGEGYSDPSGQISRYRQAWLAALAQSSEYPTLKELDTRQDWLSSVRAHGPVVPYRAASIAVFRLAELGGEGAFRTYFDHLSKGKSPDVAFLAAFGFTFADFYENYDVWLKHQLKEIKK